MANLERPKYRLHLLLDKPSEGVVLGQVDDGSIRKIVKVSFYPHDLTQILEVSLEDLMDDMI